MKKYLHLGLLVAAFLLTGCATTTDSVTGRKVRNMYTLQEDVQIGSEVYADTLATMRERGVPINADRARVAQLNEMVTRIAAVSDLPDLPYEVVLIQTNIVNAMAAPGGKIMVYEGLWDPEEGLARDDQELAAVIAHEIAHVNARHSTEAMTRQVLPNVFYMAGSAAAQLMGYEGIASAIGGVFDLYNGIWVTRYSREDEMEADSLSLMYMAKAGYDPRAALRIWERAEQRQSGNDPAASIFSTHPPSSQRIQNLRTRLPSAMAVYEAR